MRFRENSVAVQCCLMYSTLLQFTESLGGLEIDLELTPNWNSASHNEAVFLFICNISLST